MDPNGIDLRGKGPVYRRARIEAMDRAVDETLELLDALEKALLLWERRRGSFRDLRDYYGGRLWQQDRRDYEAGALPEDLTEIGRYLHKDDRRIALLVAQLGRVRDLMRGTELLCRPDWPAAMEGAARQAWQEEAERKAKAAAPAPAGEPPESPD
ncbi:MAG: DUF4298 domain-containing protein [Oscillospiraceae bacterium]|nr:DUF4298 domain-containing protein [Oscillospiraceae bacterium]